MKRRDFLSLCGLAAGSCLVPDAIARAIRDTCVLADRPYLILPRDPSDTLYALTTDGTTDFMLHLGDPFAASNPPTWNEYFEEFEGFSFKDKKSVSQWWIEQVGDPEDEDDPMTIKADETIDGVALEKWENRKEMHDGPAAQAFHMLGELPLAGRQIQCHGTDPVSTGDEVSAELTSCLGIKQNSLGTFPSRLNSSLGAIGVNLI